MDNVIEKTKILIGVFEDSDLIKKLKYYKDLVIDNKELLDMIKKYNSSIDDYEKISLKKKINSYKEYTEYMKYYYELFYYIMDINKRFKMYTVVRGCHK